MSAISPGSEIQPVQELDLDRYALSLRDNHDYDQVIYWVSRGNDPLDVAELLAKPPAQNGDFRAVLVAYPVAYQRFTSDLKPNECRFQVTVDRLENEVGSLRFRDNAMKVWRRIGAAEIEMPPTRFEREPDGFGSRRVFSEKDLEEKLKRKLVEIISRQHSLTLAEIDKFFRAEPNMRVRIDGVAYQYAPHLNSSGHVNDVHAHLQIIEPITGVSALYDLEGPDIALIGSPLLEFIENSQTHDRSHYLLLKATEAVANRRAMELVAETDREFYPREKVATISMAREHVLQENVADNVGRIAEIFWEDARMTLTPENQHQMRSLMMDGLLNSTTLTNAVLSGDRTALDQWLNELLKVQKSMQEFRANEDYKELVIERVSVSELNLSERELDRLVMLVVEGHMGMDRLQMTLDRITGGVHDGRPTRDLVEEIKLEIEERWQMRGRELEHELGRGRGHELQP